MISIRLEINEAGNRKAKEKNQWNQKLVLWKDKQYWQIFSYSDQEN